MLLNWVLKKVILMARDLGKGGLQMQVYLQGRKKALEATKSAKPGLLEKS